MNNGGICVSVCAQTADELIAKIKRAQEYADLIEVRFDCLTQSELGSAIDRTASRKFSVPLAATFRSRIEGGRGAWSVEDEAAFWNKVPQNYSLYDRGSGTGSIAWNLQNSINSFHDNVGTPGNLDDIYDAMLPGCDIWKIAVRVTDADDGIAVWKLLERARNDGRPFIPIAMGEAGKWTRILGLAHGAFMTYASIEQGAETAEGQLTIEDALNVYRVKELDRETKVYGVIGDPVTESLSPYIHNAAFVTAGINAVFIPLQVKDIDAFFGRMVLPPTREVELNFAGFAVTMPHKQSVMKYLEKVDPVAAVIGAVNTVRIENGQLSGYNTDANGFLAPLRSKFGGLNGMRVAVLGAGGAARACVHALGHEGADITVFVRNEEKASEFVYEFGVKITKISNLRSEIADFDVLVNATPLGMQGGSEEASLLTAHELKDVKLVFDLVTAPHETPLIREAKKAGVRSISGVEMLIEQAVKQFEIWTGRDAPREVMRAAALTWMENHE